MYYRFKCGVFIEAETFELAQIEFIRRISNEKEKENRWHECTCTGLSHRHNCSVLLKEQVGGEIPF